MFFLITPRRSRGTTLEVKPVKRTHVIRGNLIITNQVCEALNRHSLVATVRPIYAHGPLMLPELFDATMSAMATEGFTLSGIELEGGTWYAQSWWCRPIHQ